MLASPGPLAPASSLPSFGLAAAAADSAGGAPRPACLRRRPELVWSLRVTRRSGSSFGLGVLSSPSFQPSREQVCDWGGPETVWALLCVAERHATRLNGEWGISTRRHMLGHERPEALSPGTGVVLPDLQSSIDCQ